MKLLQCHIENFGKFCDASFTFTDGVNVIWQENGWGKSTLAAFLRVMFFGFENENKQDKRINERKRYTPWQGGVYGGSVTFEAGGSSYIMRRVFGKKGKDDEFELRDPVTNLPSDDYTTNIGEELFQIDGASFRRTVFLSQQDCETEATDGIHAKLGNLVENTDDINNFQTVYERLRDQTNRMTPTRKTGSLNKEKVVLAEMENALREEETIAAGIRQVEALRKKEIQNKQALERQIGEWKLRQQTLSESLDVRVKKQEYSRCQDAYRRAKEAFTVCLEEKPEPLSAEETGEWESLLERYPQGVPDVPASPVRETDEESASPALAAVLATGALGLVLALGLGVFVHAGLGVLVFATVAALVFFLFVREKKARERKESERAKRVALFEQVRADAVRYQILSAKREVVTEEEKRYLRRCEQARADYEQATRELTVFEQENDMEKLRGTAEPAAEETLSHIHESLTACQEKRDETEALLESYDRQLLELQERLDECQSMRAEWEERKERFERGKKKYELLLQTMKLLAEAKDSLTFRYMKPVQDAFERYYYKMKGQAADGYRFDAGANLTVEEQGLSRETRFLSEGRRDLAGICTRMAFVDAMYKGEKPFIILDDPFVNLDDDGTAGALELLREIGGAYQVIYFTCHKSRA